MVKREPGFSPATGDREFFELEVGASGSKIRTRGVAEPQAGNSTALFKLRVLFVIGMLVGWVKGIF